MEQFIFKGRSITLDDLNNNNVKLDFMFFSSDDFAYGQNEYRFIEYIIVNDYLKIDTEIEDMLMGESIKQKHITGASTLYALLKQKNYNFERIIRDLVDENYNIRYDLDLIIELLDLYPDKFVFWNDMLFKQNENNIITLVKKLITYEYKFTVRNIVGIADWIGIEVIINMLRNTYYKFKFDLIKQFIQKLNKNEIARLNFLIEIIKENDINPDVYYLLLYAYQLQSVALLELATQYPIPDLKQDTNKEYFLKAIKEYNLEDYYLKLFLK